MADGIVIRLAACKPACARETAMPLLISLVVVLLAVATYAQLRIAAFTRGAGRILLTRLLLLVVGVGFGWELSAGVEGGFERLLVLLAGLGIVHVPAAIILFIKQRRGAGKS